ncbi:NADH dehydrogenase subunit J [Leptospira ryugenii]|uniref:NADH-quinone oxidoreductase subunit J n=1 Tax=Leptospira ryugenii TaxID=1917863 RepID=A0A2P2DYA4_9LEPT|nr:NADH-quinone oxidoreductase subunit J [Leptospira ryugenii]GBF49614.1 NADH dehydrogenase subunit J [Leptospira ryugenii]
MIAPDHPSFYLFLLFGTVAVITALNVIFQKNPVVSAVSLVFTFFSLAGIYAIMGAFFIATMQVLVYAGAIMVLVVFVIMLLSQRAETLSKFWDNPLKVLALSVFGMLFFFTLFSALQWGVPKQNPETKGYTVSELQTQYQYPINGGTSVTAEGNVAAVGAATYLDYVLPFELLSILLLVAVVGAVILAKRRLTTESTKDSTL